MAHLSSVRQFVILTGLLCLSACAPGQASAPALSTPQASPTHTVPVLATRLPDSQSPPPAPATPQPAPGQAAPTAPINPPQSEPPAGVVFVGPLSVRIKHPLDNAVVQARELELSGAADPETVVSIDDQFVLVGSDRSFSVRLTLAEGPNVIEITASDLQGNQATAYLTVTYEPQP